MLPLIQHKNIPTAVTDTWGVGWGGGGLEVKMSLYEFNSIVQTGIPIPFT